jgi:hypothetical protein
VRDPRIRHLGCGHSGQHPIKGRSLRVALRAVTGDHHDLAIAGGGQRDPCSLRQLGIHLDGGHVAGTEPFSEQRGGVAGPGIDLQHPHPRLNPSSLQHYGDDVRARRRTGRHPPRPWGPAGLPSSTWVTT